MQIVAFNSSPRDNETSKTELILQKFLEGARRAGASTETIYLRQYKIKDCLGCFSCWIKDLGRCVQKDDMAELLFEHYLKADVAVLATPIYYMTMNARMKAFIDRTLPLMDPLAEVGPEGGHPYRYEKVPKVAVLSVCAFWDQSMFQPLSLNMKMIFGQDLIAEIYRHSSEALGIPRLQPQVDKVLAAVGRAGEEVVREGKVQEETMAALTQDLAPATVMMEMAREYWTQMVEQAGHK
ncbi:MAG: flavodoxin family protein [Deltaproteobacteria bacterium]|nr:flavodoxin family protein [Deltaproteobacteria bacterium]